MIDDKSVIENIKESYEFMFAAEKKVADFILNNPERAVVTNVSELAELSGASDATVIRMCKRIGYEGYYQMKIKLSHDLGKDRVLQLQNGTQRPENLNDIFQVTIANMLSLAEKQDIQLILNCVDLIKKSKVVQVIATGNTIPIAMDFTFRLGRLGIYATNSVIADYFLNNISLASSDDLVIAISYSGTSRHVVKALEFAKQCNVKTMVITSSERSPAARLADYLICTTVKNPIFVECDYGMTSHLYEMAIIDVILYFLTNKDVRVKNSDEVEMLLSEYKL